jgi:hypothetical protein
LFIFLDVIGFLRYFFSMQCPDCGYICFKHAKDCGGCGFSFKKANTSTASLFRNESFTIFAGSETLEKEQESSAVAPSANNEEIAVMEPVGDAQESPENESGDFLLNLSDAEQEPPVTDAKSSDSDNMEFSSFSSTDINLEEVEVEGLGLGLEPDESPVPEIDNAEPEESPLEIIELSEVGTPEDESSDVPIEIEVAEEPDVEIILPSEGEAPSDEAPAIETNDLIEVSLVEDEAIENVEEELELNPAESQETVEPAVPVLDLGEDEISLEIDEDFETGSPAEPPAPPVEIEDLGLNLEIDDSDAPLSTTIIEIPEIEIEDLGLELEDSDSPPTPDPEKPEP